MDADPFQAFGMLHKEIAEIIGITENTLGAIIMNSKIEQGGIEKLKEILPIPQPESELKEHIVMLETY